MAYIEATNRLDKDKGIVDVSLYLDGDKPCLEIHTLNQDHAEKIRRRIRGAVINFTQNYSQNPYFHVEETHDNKVKVVGNINNVLNEIKQRNIMSHEFCDVIGVDKDAEHIIKISKQYDKDEVEMTSEQEEAIIRLLSDKDERKEEGSPELLANHELTPDLLVQDVMQKLCNFEPHDQKLFLQHLASSVKDLLGHDLSFENIKFDATATNRPTSPKVR